MLAGCYECGAKISTQASTCPACGYYYSYIGAYFCSCNNPEECSKCSGTGFVRNESSDYEAPSY
jgi:hypothetical protein